MTCVVRFSHLFQCHARYKDFQSCHRHLIIHIATVTHFIEIFRPYATFIQRQVTPTTSRLWRWFVGNPSNCLAADDGQAFPFKLLEWIR